MLIHLESLQNTQNGDEPRVVCGVSSQTVVITDPFLGGDLRGVLGIIGWESLGWESLGGNHWVGIAAVTSFLDHSVASLRAADQD